MARIAIKLIIFLIIALAGLYFLLPHLNKNTKNTLENKNNKTSIISSTNIKSLNKNLRVSFYNGQPLPEVSSIIDQPQKTGAGKVSIINTNSNTDLVAELRESSNNKNIVAIAFIKKGEKFIIENLPNTKVNIILTDVNNSQATTTKAINTSENYRITPYQMASGSGKILMYRAQSSLR